MDHNEEAPLDRGSLAGSDTGLIHTRPGGGSNKHAFKVAGLTTLACLLLASQAFTAYMVFGQKQQIHALQENSEQMSKQIVRSSRVVPMKMQMPMETLPLLRNYSPDKDMKITETPMLKLQDTVVSVEKQVQDLIQDSKLPLFNETFLANLQGLKRQMNETEWQSLETWMRFWLIFQMAQQKPAPIPAPQTKTKCQTEAEPGATRKIGSYKPQCDDQGRYLPTQCWHPTGYCWCVDQDGTVIEGTTMRGRPGCERAPLNMMRLPNLMQKLSSAIDKSGE